MTNKDAILNYECLLVEIKKFELQCYLLLPVTVLYQNIQLASICYSNSKFIIYNGVNLLLTS